MTNVRSTCLSILAALTLLVLPLRAGADMLDVIENTLNDGCDMAKYLAIVDDFNAYYKDRGYQTEILLPLHAERQDIEDFRATAWRVTSRSKVEKSFVRAALSAVAVEIW